ncbi:alkylated DNA repair protein alkB homolog 8 [Cyclospora cayetanensis]|uniref:Alkylated DNA repair protein alkB homolog 8 n=1 Tax=Cyclospora cayetanensis TaxID=88456 RepID=A0A6P6RXM1_9EIME|nr:alkylated DNA repair protein alkB homolog 8 [Cyclospora cayetanensis]
MRATLAAEAPSDEGPQRDSQRRQHTPPEQQHHLEPADGHQDCKQHRRRGHPRRQRQQKAPSRPESVAVPPELLGAALERQHVDYIYEKIAPHFNHTRYLALNRKLLPGNVTQVCREISGIADGVLCIAVLHHLTTEARRLHALGELARITRPGGRILIYVWALQHEAGSVGERRFPSQDVLVPWVYQKRFEQSRAPADADGGNEAGGFSGPLQGPSCVPEASDTLGDETVYRYYRVFTQDELLGLCAQEQRVKVLDCWNDTNNWAVLLERRIDT